MIVDKGLNAKLTNIEGVCSCLASPCEKIYLPFPTQGVGAKHAIIK